jgi:hypothetical protein
MALMVLSIVNSLIILFYECNSYLLFFFFLIITENLNQPLVKHVKNRRNNVQLIIVIKFQQRLYVYIV